MDGPDVMQETKLKAVIGVGGVIIGLAHGGGSPHDIITRLGFMFREDGVKVIVFGHTHCPMGEERDGIFFFNPGDGRKTVGILEIKEGVLFDSRIIEL
jgi:putative phosphoesterase